MFQHLWNFYHGSKRYLLHLSSFLASLTKTFVSCTPAWSIIYFIFSPTVVFILLWAFFSPLFVQTNFYSISTSKTVVIISLTTCYSTGCVTDRSRLLIFVYLNMSFSALENGSYNFCRSSVQHSCFYFRTFCFRRLSVLWQKFWFLLQIFFFKSSKIIAQVPSSERIPKPREMESGFVIAQNSSVFQ